MRLDSLIERFLLPPCCLYNGAFRSPAMGGIAVDRNYSLPSASEYGRKVLLT